MRGGSDQQQRQQQAAAAAKKAAKKEGLYSAFIFNALQLWLVNIKSAKKCR